MQISQNIADYARSMALDCDIDSTCVFVTDKTTPDTQIHYLGNYGVDQDVLDRYKAYSVYNHDPFIDASLIERYAEKVGNVFQPAGGSLVSKCGTRAEDYWRFVSVEGVEVVGASTMRLQPRLYLTVGAHRVLSDRRRGAVPLERLSFGIEVLQNKIAASLLSSLLAGGKGYNALLGLIDPAVAPDLPGVELLSPRETEVARLVCAGKQNKEIAWLISMSECTVENHLRRIYQKLGIHNRAALVARMAGALH